jgi:hypothetical protein
VLCLRTRPRAVAGPGWLQRAHAYSAIGSPNERRGSPLALPWPSRAQSVPGHELLARVRRIRGGAATRTSRLLDRLQASYCRFCSASRTATVLPSPSGLPTSPPLPTRDIFTCTAPPAAATATAALLVTARSLRTLSVAPSVAASPPLIAQQLSGPLRPPASPVVPGAPFSVAAPSPLSRIATSPPAQPAVPPYTYTMASKVRVSPVRAATPADPRAVSPRVQVGGSRWRWCGKVLPDHPADPEPLRRRVRPDH